MAEKYVNVDALLSELPHDLPYKGSVKRVLMQAPTADVVEVVRCKDCKNCLVYQKWNKKEYFGCCRNGEVYEVDGNHYCSYGERKE